MKIPPSDPASSALYIVGCGGFGLEVLSYCIETRWRDDDNLPSATLPAVAGFIDAAPVRRTDAFRLWGNEELAFVCAPDKLPAGTRFVVAIGDPTARSAMFTRCVDAGLVPVNLIHPLARIDVTAQLGDGLVICPFVFVGPFSTIHDNVVLNIYASVGHDARVGHSSVLCPYATLTGAASIGQRSLLSTHASVLPECALGNDSKLSAASVLTEQTDDGVLSMGNPARSRVMYRSKGNDDGR